MSRKVRVTLLSLLAVATLIAVGVWGVYLSTQRVQPFYAEALAVEPEQLELGGQELESRAAALYSDSQQAGEWNAVFTAEHINGWLATQLVENYGDGLPPGFGEPRVAIGPEAMLFGFTTERRGIETVVSIDTDLYLTEDGAIAVEVLAVRAGALPLPAMQIADQVADACLAMDLPVRWTHRDGRPVALIEVTDHNSPEEKRVFVDTLELHDGELYIGGHTEEEIVEVENASPR